MNVLKCALTIACCLLPTTAFAWGPSGHAIIAELAQRRLNSTAAGQVAVLLGPGVSLASVSNWAEDFSATPVGATTLPWHSIETDFKTGNAGAPSNGATDPCKSTDGTNTCIVTALTTEIAALSSTTASAEAKAIALRFVVGLVGDLHQPLDCIQRDKDDGGRQLPIEFDTFDADGAPIKLIGNFHKLWDDWLVDAHGQGWGSYVDQLEAIYTPMADVTIPLPAGFEATWASECYAQGQKAYKALPAGKPLIIDAAYQKAVEPILDAQLALAGVRLAVVLNAIFPTK